MKKMKKIIIISFLWLFIITIFGIVSVEAQGPLQQRDITFEPQVPIPGFEARKFGETGSTQYIAEYIVAIYRYGISIGAILATVVLMAAGLMWLTSGGSQEKIGQAKNMISGSIIGLVLLFGSYTILNTVNPELVSFNVREIGYIERATMGCCQVNNNDAFLTPLKSECDEVNGKYLFTNNEQYVLNSIPIDGGDMGAKTQCVLKKQESFCCVCSRQSITIAANIITGCAQTKEENHSTLFSRTAMCLDACKQQNSNRVLFRTIGAAAVNTNANNVPAYCSNNSCVYIGSGTDGGGDGDGSGGGVAN